LADSKNYRRWLVAASRLVESPSSVETCPSCGRGRLELGLVIHDPETRLGWGAIWCTCCGRGLHLSRLQIPPSTPAVTRSEAERDGTGIPDYLPIDAEVDC
jgi:hypothetical protein